MKKWKLKLKTILPNGEELEDEKEENKIVERKEKRKMRMTKSKTAGEVKKRSRTRRTRK